jgi:hypothetical protein
MVEFYGKIVDVVRNGFVTAVLKPVRHASLIVRLILSIRRMSPAVCWVYLVTVI